MSVVNFRHDKRISDGQRKSLREFCSELGGDPISLANKLGLKVFVDQMPGHESGYIEYDEYCGSPSNYKVVLNDAHSIERQKFTLAHEIGHFVLHQNSKQFVEVKNRSAEIFSFPSGYRSSDDWNYDGFPSSMEREADVFAVNLLLPLKKLRETSEYRNGEPVALATRLGLSRTLVVRRFEEARFGG